MNKILVVMSDIFFSAKINDAAKKFGTSITVVQNEAKIAERLFLERHVDQPVMLIVDLNCTTVDPVLLISRTKADPATKAIPIVGFVSHVQTELRQKAADAGCDVVVPRSVFAQDLPAILERFITPAPGPEAG
jgi:CheY-like chemotaxis protein